MDLAFYSYLVMLIYMSTFSVTYSADHTISVGQSLSTNQTLISNTRMFALGFFSPGNSTNSYIGIWYNNIPERTVVWVLNRDNPIYFSSYDDSSLVLSNGTLLLYAGLTNIIWEANVTNAAEAILLDNGNFVLRGTSAEVLWQSFDYPTDTWLPGGRIGFDRYNNRSTVLTSWRNSGDPATGLYSVGIDQNSPELFMMRNSSTRYWRSGAWNGFNFTLAPGFAADSSIFNYSYFTNADLKYFTYTSRNSVATRVTIDSLGSLRGRMWVRDNESWGAYFMEPSDQCGSYGQCGPFGVCDPNNSPMCSCLPGFVPQDPMGWSLRDGSGGCVRRNLQVCNDSRNAFLKLANIYPADSQPLPVDLQVCEFACSVKCSCNAYSLGPTGRDCLLWIGDLYDLQNRTNGRDFYLRTSDVELEPVELEPAKHNHHGKKKIIGISLPAVFILVMVGIFWLWKKKLKQTEARRNNQDLLLLNLDNSSKQNPNINEKLVKEQKVLELPMFSFSSISNATEKFSAANKLGEGGFGPVYKGSLLSGQFVAIKRLAKLSGQGMEELRNEAILIAKLQHKNLVKLLGYCTEKDEKILIYEYMPNKSLDSFLFDPTKKEMLNWSGRVRIIDGIVQGLLYLHEYSRLRIVHRDLKASNILLDGDMNPKISDFGMARIFGANDLHANTKRIVGTYGYMSPEYAMEGRFSIKSDVFAFGILLLEILSGRKNTGFRDSDFLSLLGYAWNLWENERVLELIDPVLDIPTSSSTIALRYIIVALLCVQENPDDRPTISNVLSMLNNEQGTLALPKKPAFIAGRALLFANSDGREVQNGSINYLTTSAMDPR